MPEWYFFLIPITQDRACQQKQKPAKISNRGDNKIFSWTPKLFNISNREWRDTIVWEDGETIGTEAEFLIPKTDAESMNLKEEIVHCYLCIPEFLRIHL